MSHFAATRARAQTNSNNFHRTLTADRLSSCQVNASKSFVQFHTHTRAHTRTQLCVYGETDAKAEAKWKQKIEKF